MIIPSHVWLFCPASSDPWHPSCPSLSYSVYACVSVCNSKDKQVNITWACIYLSCLGNHWTATDSVSSWCVGADSAIKHPVSVPAVDSHVATVMGVVQASVDSLHSMGSNSWQDCSTICPFIPVCADFGNARWGLRHL